MSVVKLASRIVVIVSLAAVLSACFSLPGGVPNPLADLSRSVSNRISGEIVSASGISGMTNKMMFNMVYAQVFFVGGFGADFYSLEETQGTIWKIQSRNEDGSISTVEAERAFLKALPNGDRWWYLAWRADGEEWAYEALMSRDLEPKKIRYMNPDVKRIEEAVFTDQAGSSQAAGKAADQETAAPPDEVPVSDYNLADFRNNIVGRETITVGGKRYNCEKIVWTVVDEEEKVTYTYTWWVDASVPGGLVRYDWARSDSKETLKGELVSFRSGYSSRFNSF